MTHAWAINARPLGSSSSTWIWGDNVIRGTGDSPPASAREISHGGVLSPTLCDTHTHGAMGLGVEPDPDRLNQLFELFTTQGLGEVQLSTVTLPPSDLQKILNCVRQLRSKRLELIGIHLEGPFLSKEKRGAHQSAFLQPATLSKVRELVEPNLDVVSSVTLDPLTAEAKALEWLISVGIIVAIGHTPATYEDARTAFMAGATVLTHAFNSMIPISSREPGPVIAAIEQNAWIEVIADGHHVHPSLIRWLFDLSPDRVLLVSDSMSATGLNDGEYSLAGTKILLAEGTARTEDGSLAGSTIFLNQTIPKLVGWGIDLDTALAAATVNPRIAYGKQIPDLLIGNPATFLIWSESGHLTHLVRDGEISNFSNISDSNL